MATTKIASASRAEVVTALVAERHDILELYQSLSPAEWEQMTLCTLWTVRDMLAHLITINTPVWAYIMNGFNEAMANQKLIDRLGHLTNEQLLEWWARCITPPGLSRMVPSIYLPDDWVHNQDVRWPLNRPRQHDPTRIRLVLELLCKFDKKRIAGLHLICDDIDWEYGIPGQPQVIGSAEALAMGLANRPAAKSYLKGEAVERLFTSSSGHATIKKTSV